MLSQRLKSGKGDSGEFREPGNLPPVFAPAHTVAHCLLLGSLLPPQNIKSFFPPLPGAPFLHVTARLTPQKSLVSDQIPPV